jgi:pimeloyl-ACP methyl ester carboxylesterase
MSAWALTLRPQAPGLPGPATPTWCLVLGAATLSISAALLLSDITANNAPKTKTKNNKKGTPIPSPLTTHLPHLTPSEISQLPYPPNILPGARTVPTPYGRIHVFEFGPVSGPKVLLLHGISTPCVSLASLAEVLVARGCRVMLFDLFGRGYSDAPTELDYDLRLYTAQVLMVLASSELAWTGDDGFHLVGYSLGGGLAVGFARYFPRMVRSVVVIAGGGLVRREHVGWRSRVLYESGWVPDRIVHWLVKSRLMPRDGEKKGERTETTMAAEVVGNGGTQDQGKWHKNASVSGGDEFDNAVLLARRPEYTVSSVMDWQMKHHPGFIPAFVSSIRHAPIYEQTEDWLTLGQLLAERRAQLGREQAAQTVPGLRGGKILMILGASDPVVIKEELIHDTTAVLGEDGFEAVILDAGHEVVMTRAVDIARVMLAFWQRTQGNGSITSGKMK